MGRSGDEDENLSDDDEGEPRGTTTDGDGGAARDAATSAGSDSGSGGGSGGATSSGSSGPVKKLTIVMPPPLQSTSSGITGLDLPLSRSSSGPPSVGSLGTRDPFASSPAVRQVGSFECDDPAVSLGAMRAERSSRDEAADYSSGYGGGGSGMARSPVMR